MDALLILALGSLALLGLFAAPVLADHVQEHHRSLRRFTVGAPRPVAETKAGDTVADDASPPDAA